MAVTPILLLVACTGGSATDTTGSVPSETGETPATTGIVDSATDSAPPPSYAGTPPAEALGLPEFTVSNQYGLMRSADYLEGSPVALWFFTTGWTDC